MSIGLVTVDLNFHARSRRGIPGELFPRRRQRRAHVVGLLIDNDRFDHNRHLRGSRPTARAGGVSHLLGGVLRSMLDQAFAANVRPDGREGIFQNGQRRLLFRSAFQVGGANRRQNRLDQFQVQFGYEESGCAGDAHALLKAKAKHPAAVFAGFRMSCAISAGENIIFWICPVPMTMFRLCRMMP